MNPARIAELRTLKAAADAAGMSGLEVAIYNREARTALPEALDAIERVRELADSWGMATVITGNPRSDAMRKLVQELRAALEGKSE